MSWAAANWYVAPSMPPTEIGDLTFAAYSCNELITNFLAVGDPLAEVQPEAESGLAFAQKARFGLVIDIITAQLGFIRTLRGLTPKFGSFNHEGFDELQFERHLASNPLLGLPEFWYWVRKVQARFFAGDYAVAVDASLHAQRLLWTSPSQFETAEFRFYGALSHAAAWDSASPDQRQQHFEALTVHHQQLEVWAENCPENFENRAALVGAEIARIEGRDLDAMRLYEQAIRSARENGFVHDEGVANEVAAPLLLDTRFREDRVHLPAGGPVLLPALGSHWEGATTRGVIPAGKGREAPPRSHEHDRGARRPAGSSYRDQDIASGVR